ARGHLAMAGPAERRGTAYNWYASAADRQHPAPMLLPPLIITPMAARLGAFYLATKKPDEAIDAYQRALTAFPNDMNSLVGLKSAYEITGNTAQAEAIAKKIEELKAE
ncbi:MAG TPA: tetratricopeptide repeat protein, partial [Fibrobacteria bacterium]|nr:tetratricopeptide repeat protein [Fibrobacteria bacterium]